MAVEMQKFIPKQKRHRFFQALFLSTIFLILEAHLGGSAVRAGSVPDSPQILGLSLLDSKFEDLPRPIDSSSIGTASDYVRPHSSQNNSLSFYRDSSGTSMSKTLSSVEALLDRFDVAFSQIQLDSQDASGSQRLKAASLKANARLSEMFHLGGNMEVSRAGDLGGKLLGSIDAGGDFRSSSLNAAVKRELVTSTTQAIRNGIYDADYQLGGSHRLPGGGSLGADYHHRSYSDNNSSDTLNISPQYSLAVHGKWITVGYRASLAQFARESSANYFSPKRMFSNEVYSEFSFDGPRYYGSFQLSSSRRFMEHPSGDSSDFSASASDTLGVKLAENINFALTVAGGAFGLSAVSRGWSYFTVGSSLSYLF